MSDIGEPGFIGDGNTRPDSSRKTDASPSTLSACLLRGTRCSMPAFIRSDGIRHTRSLEVNLVPGRPSGLTGARRRENQEPETQLGGYRGSGRFYGFKRRPNFLIWERSEVRFHLRHGGQGSVNRFTRRVGFHETVRHCPSEDGSQPLTYPTGCLWPGRPYRGKDSQHVASVYSVNRRTAKPGHGVALQGLDPACRVLGVTPTGFVRFMDGTGGFLESRCRRHPLLGERIATVRDGGPVIPRLLASFSQAYGGVSAQADIASAPFNSYAQDSRLASRFADVKVQAPAVRVSPRFLERLSPRRR